MAEPAVTTNSNSNRADLFLLGLLAISLLSNVGLGIAVLRLSGQVAPAAAARQPSGPAIGAQLPPLEAERLGGSRETISYQADRRPTLMYVFTPECSWCARNLANLKALLAEAKDEYRLVGVSLNPDVEAYLSKAQLELPVYVNVAPEAAVAYGFGSTPQTLVISPEGRVVKSWIGAYGGAAQADVERTFGVRLPGLAPPAVSAKGGAL
jgi:peroxiredoxin